MNEDEIINIFKEKLQTLQTKGKYVQVFTEEDKNRALKIFQLALLNPNISESTLFEILTGLKLPE